MGRDGEAVTLSCSITKGRWKVSCPNHLLLFECASERPLLCKGTSLKMLFISFFFPANSLDLGIYPVALVIGAVSRVICMDTV